MSRTGAGESPSWEATGDQHEWGRLVPLVWRMLADPGGRYDYPDQPDDLDDATAWWAPLLQLLWYSLGWPRPDIGLRAWVDAGKPTDDPRLELLDRLWGGLIDYFCAWLWSGGADQQSAALSHELSLRHPKGQAIRADRAWLENLERRRPPDAHHLPYGGGFDPLHLASHGVSGIAGEPSVDVMRSSREDRRAVIVVDAYAGWYRALATAGGSLPPLPADRSWRVDVLVRPTGWLGTYRRSRLSGRWFSGPHRIHEMGCGR